MLSRTNEKETLDNIRYVESPDRSGLSTYLILSNVSFSLVRDSISYLYRSGYVQLTDTDGSSNYRCRYRYIFHSIVAVERAGRIAALGDIGDFTQFDAGLCSHLVCLFLGIGYCQFACLLVVGSRVIHRETDTADANHVPAHGNNGIDDFAGFL